MATRCFGSYSRSVKPAQAVASRLARLAAQLQTVHIRRIRKLRIADSKYRAKFPTDLGIPPLRIGNIFESNLLKSGFSARGLAADWPHGLREELRDALASKADAALLKDPGFPEYLGLGCDFARPRRRGRRRQARLQAPLVFCCHRAPSLEGRTWWQGWSESLLAAVAVSDSGVL